MKLLCQANALSCATNVIEIHPLIGVVIPLAKEKFEIENLLAPTSWGNQQNKNYKMKTLNQIRKLCGNEYQEWSQCVNLRNVIMFYTENKEYEKAYKLCPSLNVIKTLSKLVHDNKKMKSKELKIYASLEDGKFVK